MSLGTMKIEKNRVLSGSDTQIPPQTSATAFGLSRALLGRVRLQSREPVRVTTTGHIQTKFLFDGHAWVVDVINIPLPYSTQYGVFGNGNRQKKNDES